MTDKEIYSKIESIYNSEKGKSFITHLLRSFFPAQKTNYAFFHEDNKKYVCCITNEKLSTKEDMINIINSKEGENALMENLKNMGKAMVNNDKTYTHPESVIELRKKIKPLALICEESDKCLSEQAYQQLHNFFMTEILKGNKHINWIVNNERAKKFVEIGKKDGYIKTKKEERAIHKVAEHSNLKLGDLEALQNIKKKFEKEENNNR